MRFAIPVIALLIASGGASLLQAQESEKGWTSLFDGKSLKGWEQRGGKAVYTVEGDAIVGTTVPKTPNSFLCTEKVYGDFVLELEFKVDPALNSGIQIRSNSLPGYKEGRVHGYQVEIDASDRGWSGGIYDEGRRGWLYPLGQNRAARYAFRQNEWNHYRIEAIGDSIRTWINGVPAADLVDSMTQRGFIALQVHGVGDRKEKMQVRWRKIRIQNLGTSSWRPLMNTMDLAGWVVPKAGTWGVEDGILRGVNSSMEKRHSLLLTEKKYKDFTLRVVYKANTGNSGLYFRCEKTDDAYGALGMQAEIDSAGKGNGGLYEIGGRKWVVQPKEELTKKTYGVGEWNEMTVSAHGARIVTHLNGVKIADVRDDPGRREGFIGLQLHALQDVNVEFRAVDILDTRAKRPVSEPAKASASLPPVVPEGAKVKLLGEGYKFTEGPAEGPDGRIYFSDIPNERIHVYDPESGKIDVFREQSGRANGLMWTPAGALIACEGGNRKLTRQIDGVRAVLAEKFGGKLLNSPNDLMIDGTGGIYFTDPRYGDREGMEMEVEAVYYLPRGGALKQVLKDLTKPNGLILSPDETILYVADAGATKIWAYDVTAPGVLVNKRLFAESGSDGMTVDERGNVYLTFKGEVLILSPSGMEIGKITPPEGPANVTFGGKEGKTLYMTARTGFYSIELNVRGGLLH